LRRFQFIESFQALARQLRTSHCAVIPDGRGTSQPAGTLPAVDTSIPESVLAPSYWLVYGLDWPATGGDFRESVIAFAPSSTVRASLSLDALDVLEVADAFRLQLGLRTVFFSDLTLWLFKHGSSWGERWTDWEAGWKDIVDRSGAPAMYLGLSQLAHLIVCDASELGVTLHFTDGSPSRRVSAAERAAVRSDIEQELSRTWPAYIRNLVADGRLRW